MTAKQILKFDVIGYWSEVKLDIIRKYASAYSRILAARENPRLYHIYIDGFAGAGINTSKATGKLVPGSPLIALQTEPSFREYHFVDLNPGKSQHLEQLSEGHPNVFTYNDDCNTVLLDRIFPKARYKDYHRALCLLDPYGLHLNWDVIATAGKMKSIDMFLNFPVADMNRNVIWRIPEGMSQYDLDRMNAFWGDDSWRQVAYSTNKNLFGYPEKEDNETIADGFRQRLITEAGFKHVPVPLPMKNSQNAVVYYLFFASQKPVAAEIIEDIFQKYRK